MTSSLRNHSGPRWDYDKHEFKEHDPFCEPGLISIIFIAKGRGDLTRLCLESTERACKAYGGEVEWIFIENGLDEENYQTFMDFDATRKVVVRQDNFGINHALNQAWALSRGEFCMVHENDWLNADPQFNFLQVCEDIFARESNVGIIQLRSITDHHENWGFGKPDYSPWSCGKPLLKANDIEVWDEKTKCGHEYLVSDFANGFNNNPCLIRKELFRQCGFMSEPKIGTDPRHDETHYQHIVANTAWSTAHINHDVYYHAGGAARELFVQTGRLV